MPNNPQNITRADVVSVCNQLYHKGLVVAKDGNVSVRISAFEAEWLRCWITPSGFPLRDVGPEDLVEIAQEGPALIGAHRPSSEWKMHAAIYTTVPDVGAIVHAHPPYATAFAASGRALDAPVFPEALVEFGEIPLLPYATPSTAAVGALVAEAIAGGATGVLLQNHGATTVGRTIWDAFYRMEKLEHIAQMMWLSEALGGAQALPPAEIERLKNLYGSP